MKNQLQEIFKSVLGAIDSKFEKKISQLFFEARVDKVEYKDGKLGIQVTSLDTGTQYDVNQFMGVGLGHAKGIVKPPVENDLVLIFNFFGENIMLGKIYDIASNFPDIQIPVESGEMVIASQENGSYIKFRKNGDIVLNPRENSIIGIPEMPLGSITAWNKNMPNMPPLPPEWVECNGQTLNDPSSPFHGQTIPDLNGPIESGLKGRFLRGHTESGLTETSQNLAHTHTISTRNATGNTSGLTRSSTVNTSTTTASSGGQEARPHSYSVVWIMKIK